MATVQIVDDDDDDIMLGDDDWEDEDAFEKILKALPPGWHLIKVVNYTYNTLSDIRKWCGENCRSEWSPVNWASGCSYSTAVQFENLVDATFFKLRWG